MIRGKIWRSTKLEPEFHAHAACVYFVVMKYLPLIKPQGRRLGNICLGESFMKGFQAKSCKKDHWKTMKLSVAFIIILGSISSAVCLERPNKCLHGDKHKEAPSSESSLHACLAYKENACCTAAFTKQLDTLPVKGVGNFSWSPCNGTLSSKCEAFMIEVECFYRCSHNAIFWKNPNHDSSIRKAPICASECDAWLEACKDDFTCARNWVTDYNMSSNGANTCKQPCQKYSHVYSSGKDLCENLWGATFDSL